MRERLPREGIGEVSWFVAHIIMLSCERLKAKKHRKMYRLGYQLSIPGVYGAGLLVALEFGDAVGHVAVVDVHGVYLAEAVERLFGFAGVFEGHAQIIA